MPSLRPLWSGRQEPCITTSVARRGCLGSRLGLGGVCRRRLRHVATAVESVPAGSSDLQPVSGLVVFAKAVQPAKLGAELRGPSTGRDSW